MAIYPRLPKFITVIAEGHLVFGDKDTELEEMGLLRRLTEPDSYPVYRLKYSFEHDTIHIDYELISYDPNLNFYTNLSDWFEEYFIDDEYLYEYEWAGIAFGDQRKIPFFEIEDQAFEILNLWKK